MTINEFKDYVKTGNALDTEDIHMFMDEMSDAARRITFRLNAAYHTQAEVRKLLSELFGCDVPSSLRVFPPFYTDFGKNITNEKMVTEAFVIEKAWEQVRKHKLDESLYVFSTSWASNILKGVKDDVSIIKQKDKKSSSNKGSTPSNDWLFVLISFFGCFLIP